MTAPDPDLVERARAGDREAFSRLALPHRRAIAGNVEARLPTALRARLDVDDLVQETLLRAMLAVGNFEWQGETSFRSWLLTIADNVAHEAQRRHLGTHRRDVRRETRPESDADPGDDVPDPMRLLRREERFHRLAEALRRLPPEHRQVIALARLEGLPLADVGARMGRSAAATSALLLRALRGLRHRFEPTDSLGLPARKLDLESRPSET